MSVNKDSNSKKPRIGAGAVTSSPAGLLHRVLHYKFHIGWVFWFLTVCIVVLGSLLLLELR